MNDYFLGDTPEQRKKLLAAWERQKQIDQGKKTIFWLFWLVFPPFVFMHAASVLGYHAGYLDMCWIYWAGLTILLTLDVMV